MDLAGRLSNPPEVVESLADQGFQAKARLTRRSRRGANRAADRASAAEREQRGRLSNPVQRRLAEAEVDELVARYVAGSAIDELARVFEVNRTTVISHLDRRDIPRRRVVRKMTDRMVAEAARRYGQGLSLKAVAEEFGVDARTLARELRRADVPIRPRRGYDGAGQHPPQRSALTPTCSVPAVPDKSADLELDRVIPRAELRPELAEVLEASEWRRLGQVNDASDDGVDHLRVP